MLGAAFLRAPDVTVRIIEEEDIDFLCDRRNDLDVWPSLHNLPLVNRVAEREFVEERVTDEESVSQTLYSSRLPVAANRIILL